MKRLLLTTVLTLFMSGSAFAKTSPEIMTPYKEYVAALKSGDNKLAFQKARQAYKAAEKLLGDSKMTGDLAANFGGQRTVGLYSYQDYKDRLEAWRRSAELAHYHGELGPDLELERRFELIEHTFTLKEYRNGKEIIGGKGNEFGQMEKALDRLNKRGSIFEGDMEVMRARWYQLKKKHKKSRAAGLKARDIYAKAAIGVESQYQIMGTLYLANSQRELGNDLEAALAYQDMMNDVNGELSASHRLVKTAFSGWVRSRAELVKDGKLADAKTAGLKNPWPFNYYDQRGKAIFEMKPQYHYKNNAWTRINQTAESGLLIVQFDLNAKGSPVNIKFNSAPNKALEEPFLKAFRQWLYTPNDSETIPEYRKNLTLQYGMQFINDLNQKIR